VRRPKRKNDSALWPKVPAVCGLLDLGILTSAQVHELQWPAPIDWSLSSSSTFQEIWVEFQSYGSLGRAAYLYFDFYNGAMSTKQCSRMMDAMNYILSTDITDPIATVVLMGGSYFSNGIALNVIEAAQSPAEESWFNINRINDVVHYLLHEFPSRNILTVAGIRGNAAAGGVALAAACDVVICGAEVVLNPAYRAIGLHGSEYHSISYVGRCGHGKAHDVLRSMIALSPFEARANGLVDYVLQGSSTALEKRIKSHVGAIITSGLPVRGWKAYVDLSPASLATARAKELCEMSKDFFSARHVRYDSRRSDFIRKVKPKRTPLRLALHRRTGDMVLDEEETDEFDDVHFYEKLATQLLLSKVSNPEEPQSSKTVRAGESGGEMMFTCYFE
jgi:enoyl-CoA hydratase/carnithine racemase